VALPGLKVAEDAIPVTGRFFQMNGILSVCIFTCIKKNFFLSFTKYNGKPINKLKFLVIITLKKATAKISAASKTEITNPILRCYQKC
jgi:hypothetical protein